MKAQLAKAPGKQKGNVLTHDNSGDQSDGNYYLNSNNTYFMAAVYNSSLFS